MIPKVDGTHDASLRSWVESANDPATDFPVQNLPLGVFRYLGEGPSRIGCAIGDRVLDLVACAERGLLRGMPSEVEEACREARLNALMSLDPRVRGTLRHRLSHLLRAEGGLVTARTEAANVLVPRKDARMELPAAIGDYTDFYASVFHATNVGKMMRPDHPLLPNYKWLPIGYHGRASSLVVSGTAVRRPCGQTEPSGGLPGFGPSRNLDYELEVGAFLGPGNPLGEPVPIAAAEDRIFGLCLLNDWSARDLQKWEYQPLGPFLAKSFATTVSPWVVTLEALAPYRVPASARPEGDPRPLPYLAHDGNEAQGGIDLRLEVLLSSKAMREKGLPPVTVSRSRLRDLYWTLAQMVAHHTSNGCNLRPGDLIATGTVSGADEEAWGSLLERTWRGTRPLALPSGEERRFLEDGDEVILRGQCAREGFARIGFGECRGVVQGANG
ncbi:MAG TPA: fumarylacetoacetase [Vicinamibacteria bacterium]|nr:fumarylacetoacetase [Vicinamibacteria bacterium]